LLTWKWKFGARLQVNLGTEASGERTHVDHGQGR